MRVETALRSLLAPAYWPRTGGGCPSAIESPCLRLWQLLEAWSTARLPDQAEDMPADTSGTGQASASLSAAVDAACAKLI